MSSVSNVSRFLLVPRIKTIEMRKSTLRYLLPIFHCLFSNLINLTIEKLCKRLSGMPNCRMITTPFGAMSCLCERRLLVAEQDYPNVTNNHVPVWHINTTFHQFMSRITIPWFNKHVLASKRKNRTIWKKHLNTGYDYIVFVWLATFNCTARLFESFVKLLFRHKGGQLQN